MEIIKKMTNNTTGALSVIEAYIEKSGIDASEEVGGSFDGNSLLRCKS